MLRTIGLTLISIGIAMLVFRKLTGLKLALKPQKMERNAGDDIPS